MISIKPHTGLIKTALAAGTLLCASASALAQSSVTLTATPQTAVLADGQSVAM